MKWSGGGVGWGGVELSGGGVGRRDIEWGWSGVGAEWGEDV